ncbi:hypothetical protein [Nonomuraea longicatena]|uniref:Uncharacterized protein n=1 Tax=Nonomuraea longicatena TaxID=83682 RepID=A0ABP4AJT3_9ACTN
MSEPALPPWTDDLFPFPTPPPLARLVDLAWENMLREGYYDYIMLECHYDFMFDLAAVPGPPAGWESTDLPRPDGGCDVPMFSVPEFVPFGSRGDGGWVGWAVPAPELGRTDHPVCIADGHQYGLTPCGDDTRAGLAYLLARVRSADERLARELGVTLDPIPDGPDDVDFEVPPGWRCEPGYDGIGVLAPAAAFAGQDPVVALVDQDEPLEPALADAARWLDAGRPATALLGLKDTYVNTPLCLFAELKPLWARAYTDLGRPQYAARLDVMARMYGALPCFCATPHT